MVPVLFMDEVGESTWRLLLPLLPSFLVRRRPCPILGKKGDNHMYFLSLQGKKRMGRNAEGGKEMLRTVYREETGRYKEKEW